MLQDPRHLHISDYSYELPDERIARYPLPERDQSRLLVYRHGTIADHTFTDLPGLLPEGALMVCNNTRVIQARLHFRKDTGALIEVFLMEPARPTDYEQVFQTRGRCAWRCMVGNLKKWKDGALTRAITVGNRPLTLTAAMRRDLPATAGGTNFWVDFEWSDTAVSFAELLEAVGELPIPPYLGRQTEESDKTTYQTVYSKIKGSVAAPTAGLHFTDRVLEAIDRRGITRDEVTLHVGAGTFKPVKSSEIEGHTMHTEYIVVHRHTLERLLAHGCRAIAVGTTSVRTLESLYYLGVKQIAATHPQPLPKGGVTSLLQLPPLGRAGVGFTPPLGRGRGWVEEGVSQWEPYDLPHNDDGLVLVDGRPVGVDEALRALLSHLDREGLEALHSSTQIIIAPGYRYKIVKALVTNFHQPQSTLLLLVSAFLGGDSWREVYRHALDTGYRFLSYGDSSLLVP